MKIEEKLFYYRLQKNSARTNFSQDPLQAVALITAAA